MKFPDIKEEYLLILENGALSHTQGRQAPKADATITITRAALNRIILGQSTVAKEMQGGAFKVEGNPKAPGELFSLLDKFDFWFNIVTP